MLSFAFALRVVTAVHARARPTGLGPTLAIFAFIFLVALGVDDNIFLMTRIREERAASVRRGDRASNARA